MRSTRIVLIILLALCGVAAIADRVAVHFAEAKAADQVKKDYALSKKPRIDVHGFPFLTQLASKDFNSVDVDLSGIEASAADGSEALRLAEAKAQLHDVKVSGTNWDRAVARSAEGHVRIGYDDISAAIPGGMVKIGYGGKTAAGQDQVRATVGTEVLGQQINQSALGTVKVVGGDTIQLRMTKLEGAASDIPGVADFIRKELNYDWKIKDLPHGLALKNVGVAADGVTISGGGSDVDLTYAR
jgi:hypothetical protein